MAFRRPYNRSKTSFIRGFKTLPSLSHNHYNLYNNNNNNNNNNNDTNNNNETNEIQFRPNNANRQFKSTFYQPKYICNINNTKINSNAIKPIPCHQYVSKQINHFFENYEICCLFVKIFGINYHTETITH